MIPVPPTLFALEPRENPWFYIILGLVSVMFALSGIVGGVRWYQGFFSTFYTPPNPNKEREKLLEDINADKKPDILYKTDKVPEWKVLPREKATRKLLKFMAFRDKWLERKYLCEILEEAYILIREAMERRSIERIENRLTEEHADELHTALKAMKKKRQRRLFGKVEVLDIHILQIETAGPKTKQTVTAMITAQSKDYVEDDETGKLVEGKRKTYYFQEFWTLRRGEKRWLVELIRPSADVDSVMESKNVVSKSDYEDLKEEVDASVLEHVVGR